MHGVSRSFSCYRKSQFQSELLKDLKEACCQSEEFGGEQKLYSAIARHSLV